MKNTLKRILGLMLAVLLCFSLMAGCAEKPADEPATDAPPADAPADEPADAPADEPADAPADEPADAPAADVIKSTSGYTGTLETAPLAGAGDIVVAYCSIGSFEVSWLQIGSGVKQAAEFHGVQFKEYSPAVRLDAGEQIAQIENAIADQVDVILLAPSDGNAVVASVEKAFAAGIPVITVNIAANTDKVTSHVSNDDYLGGKQAAEYIASKNGEKGKVVLIEGDDTLKPGIDRRTGFADGIAQYPDMEIVVSATTAWDSVAAQNAMVAALDAYDDIVGVYACWDGGTLAAYQAIVDAGRGEDGIVVVGTDAYNDALILIRDGTSFQADIYKDLTFQGYLALETAIKVGLGMEVEPFIDSGSLLLTAENIGDWMDEYGIDLEQKKADEEALAAQYA